MDCEDCRHLAVVGLHDTSPRSVSLCSLQHRVSNSQHDEDSRLPRGFAETARRYVFMQSLSLCGQGPACVACQLSFRKILSGGQTINTGEEDPPRLKSNTSHDASTPAEMTNTLLIPALTWRRCVIKDYRWGSYLCRSVCGS